VLNQKQRHIRRIFAGLGWNIAGSAVECVGVCTWTPIKGLEHTHHYKNDEGPVVRDEIQIRFARCVNEGLYFPTTPPGRHLIFI